MEPTKNALWPATSFAAQFKQLCELRGLKQVEVAERTGIPAAYISLIANGKVLPLGDWAQRIKQVLAWPTVTATESKPTRSLSIPAALYEALWQARADVSQRSGRSWTWIEFVKALLLYWQAFPPVQLPTPAELQDWYS